jgi:hypothetical protein
VTLAALAIVAAPPAHADPANCDPEMSEDQRFQKELCSAHAGCRFVMGIQDACVGVKSFLGRLGLGSKGTSGGGVTDARIEQALIDLGVPAPKLSDCIFRFDRSLCRQYLGLEEAPKADKSQPEKLTPQNELHALSSTLIEEQRGARTGTGAYYDAKSGLQACAYSQAQSDRNDICNQAQRDVDKCNAYRDGWYARKSRLLTEAPKLGIGDRFPAIPAMELPPCPYTLPGTWMTPAQAMAEWDKGGQTNDTLIARCDGMRRSLSEALDANDRERATAVVTAFEADCGRARQVYADIAAGARSRIAGMKPLEDEAPLKRRGASSLTEAIEGAIKQADITVRQREEEDRRRRQEETAVEERRRQEAAALAQREAQIRQEKAAEIAARNGPLPSPPAERISRAPKGCKTNDTLAAHVARADQALNQFRKPGERNSMVMSWNTAESLWDYVQELFSRDDTPQGRAYFMQTFAEHAPRSDRTAEERRQAIAKESGMSGKFFRTAPSEPYLWELIAAQERLKFDMGTCILRTKYK